MNKKYILVLLSGLFFSGCINQTMVKKIEINASPELVWKAIAVDLDSWGTWDPTIDRWTIGSEGVLGVGSLTKYWIGENWAIMRVVEYIPLKKIAYELSETSWPAENWDKIISIESRGSKTIVEINLTTSNHKSFINKFAHGMMFSNTLKGLRRHLEQ